MISAAMRAPGFSDPVGDAQRVFRAVLEALARPTLPQEVRTSVEPPAPLSATAGAIVLTLCDEQTPLWFDAALRETDEVETWVRFHTGATIVEDAADAAFCVVSGVSAMPALGSLRQGSDEEPHLSATVIVDAANAAVDLEAPLFVATGPGVNGRVLWDGAGVSTEFVAEWEANVQRHPRGVDLILAGDGEVRGLPRTTTLTAASDSITTTEVKPCTSL